MEYEYKETENALPQYKYERPIRDKKANKNEKDLTLRVTVMQIIVFTIISLIVFGFYKAQSETFVELKAVYNSVMQRDMSVKEIAQSIKKVMSFVSEPQNVAAESTTQKNNAIEESVSIVAEENNIMGVGGEDLMLATDNANFSPFFLSMPIVTPIKVTRVSSAFGYRINPITKQYGFHTGVDLPAKEGTDIKAAFNGVVLTVDSTSGRGNYIAIESESGIKTVYCHCSEIIAEQGAVIRAGEVIAKVGSTGQSTGPHLHFEIIINGVYYNPLWVIEVE